MTFEDYVLTYKRNDEIVADATTYYDKVISKLSKLYSRFSMKHNKAVVCCFHDDKNPSMGKFPDKKHKGAFLYHCFGCGATGDVVKMHQQIEKIYHSREVNRQDALREIAEIFDIPLGEYEEVKDVGNDLELQMQARVKEIQRKANTYTPETFHRVLLQMRCSGKVNIDEVNAEVIKLTATENGLYEV